MRLNNRNFMEQTTKFEVFVSEAQRWLDEIYFFLNTNTNTSQSVWKVNSMECFYVLKTSKMYKLWNPFWATNIWQTRDLTCTRVRILTFASFSHEDFCETPAFLIPTILILDHYSFQPKYWFSQPFFILFENKPTFSSKMVFKLRHKTI